MQTLTITQPHGLQCGRCGGTFIAPRVENEQAICNRCHAVITVATDIELEDGEMLVWLPGAPAGHPSFFAFLAYFTEQVEDVDDEELPAIFQETLRYEDGESDE